MATHNIHTSWGRTRSPKNLAGANGTAITPEADTDNLEGIVKPVDAVGYATEAQRYLHVLVEEVNPGSDINSAATTVFGYINAFQRWFPLPASFDGSGANADPTAASIDPPNSITTPPNHVPAARSYRTYHIAGIDRVAFVQATAANVNIYAACSTF